MRLDQIRKSAIILEESLSFALHRFQDIPLQRQSTVTMSDGRPLPTADDVEALGVQMMVAALNMTEVGDQLAAAQQGQDAGSQQEAVKALQAELEAAQAATVAAARAWRQAADARSMASACTGQLRGGR